LFVIDDTKVRQVGPVAKSKIRHLLKSNFVYFWRLSGLNIIKAVFRVLFWQKNAPFCGQKNNFVEKKLFKIA